MSSRDATIRSFAIVTAAVCVIGLALWFSAFEWVSSLLPYAIPLNWATAMLAVAFPA